MISFRTLADASIRLLISASSLSSAAQTKLAKAKAIVASAKRRFVEFIINLNSVPNLSTGIILIGFTSLLAWDSLIDPSRQNPRSPGDVP
jgi:hypothetical protein